MNISRFSFISFADGEWLHDKTALIIAHKPISIDPNSQWKPTCITESDDAGKLGCLQIVISFAQGTRDTASTNKRDYVEQFEQYECRQSMN